ncbi:hypothetical protein AB0B50_24240 [Streptomyces sp. NPDC041068]
MPAPPPAHAQSAVRGDRPRDGLVTAPGPARQVGSETDAETGPETGRETV